MVQSRESMRPGARVNLAYDASRFPALTPTNILNRLNSLAVDVTLEYRTENPGEWQTLKSASELTTPDGTVVYHHDREYQVPAARYLLDFASWSPCSQALAVR